MMNDEDIERRVFDLVEDYNGVSIFNFRRKRLNLDTDLNSDFKIDPIEAIDLLNDYFDKFQLDPSVFNFSNYFHNKKPPPLTIRMLVESAKAGRWLYG